MIMACERLPLQDGSTHVEDPIEVPGFGLPQSQQFSHLGGERGDSAAGRSVPIPLCNSDFQSKHIMTSYSSNVSTAQFFKAKRRIQVTDENPKNLDGEQNGAVTNY